MTKKLINITTPAQQKLCELMMNRNDYIKISIKHGGCSGFKFHLEYTDKKNEYDEEVQISEDKKIYIDAPAIMHIIGTTMDYKKDIFKSGFIFTNDRNQTCGCGQSFSI